MEEPFNSSISALLLMFEMVQPWSFSLLELKLSGSQLQAREPQVESELRALVIFLRSWATKWWEDNLIC